MEISDIEKEYSSLLDKYEELENDYEDLKDKYDELVSFIEENCIIKKENPYYDYGLDESDFH